MIALFCLAVVLGALAQEESDQDPGNTFPAGVFFPKENQTFQTRYVSFKWRVNAMLPPGSALHVIINGALFSEVGSEMRSIMAFGLEDGEHRMRLGVVSANGEDLGSSNEVHFKVRRATQTFTERIQGLKPILKPWDQNENGETDDESFKDVTFVTAALNIGRRHGFASFVDDYIANLQHILSLRWPIVVYVQKEYIEMIEPYLHPKVVIKETSIESLDDFKYAAEVEELRTSSVWVGSSRYRGGDDGRSYPARIKQYNPLVMSKPYWLRDVARDDPFKTKYFLWLDCGMCARRIVLPLQMDLMRQWMAEKFVVFGMDYGTSDGYDLHGFPHSAYEKLTGEPARVLLRGNILGGRLNVIEEVVAEYDEMLRVTLRGESPLRNEKDPLGGRAMGTEESVMTLAWHRKRNLFHVPNLSDNHLKLEMPCWMFGVISSTQPTVNITYPSDGLRTPLENTTILVDVKNFKVPEDGTVCVTFGEEDHSVECAESTSIHLPSISAGEQSIRAELVSLDGVPITVSQRVSIVAETAASDSIDWDGPILDDLDSVGRYLLDHGLSQRILIVTTSMKLPKQLQWLLSPLHEHESSKITLVRLPLNCDTAGAKSACRKSTCDDCSPAMFGSVEPTNWECKICSALPPSVLSTMYTAVVLAVAEPCDGPTLGSLLRSVWPSLETGSRGVLLGLHYYNAPLANHNVKEAVDVFALENGVNVQITQELRDRSWLILHRPS